jgi:diguanylate cyclase (GGDEF)-like protein
VLALPETDLQGALDMAESIRALVEEHRFRFEGQLLKITVSIGVAQFNREDHKSPDALLKAADKNLYTAKSRGRNCVHG